MEDDKPTAQHPPSLDSNVPKTVSEVNDSTPKKENTKVIIETSADLYKLPISVLKNTKIYDFKGKYYDRIYEEALKIERSGGLASFSINNYLKKEINIDKIIFEMKYQTQLGQELGVIGSFDELGNWNQDKALKMNWTEGNIWTKEVPFKGGDFEFKYIFIVNNKVQKWEDGNNRKFEHNSIKNLIENSLKGNDSVMIENINKMSYYYDTRNNTLKIISEWNKK